MILLVRSLRKRIHTISKPTILLILILLVGIFLRFYNYPHIYGLEGDATRDAIIAYEGAHNWYFPLVGAFSSTGPYTFGPWYYISIILADIIFPSPYSPWILMAVGTLITIIVMYDIGRLIKSKPLGLLLALLTSLAPSEFIIGGSLSNIVPVALFSSLTLWSSMKILSTAKPKLYWYLLMGIFFGLAVSAHYQSLGLFALPLFVWWLARGKGKKAAWKTLLVSFLGLMVTLIPMIIFNITHNWHTLRGVYEMYTTRDRIYVPNSWKLYLFQFWPSLINYIFGTPKAFSIAILVLVPGFVIIASLRKNLPRTIVVVCGILIINFVWLRYYWGERFWPYHYYLEPFIILLVGYSLYQLTQIKKYGLAAFVVAMLAITGCMVHYDIQREITLSHTSDSTQREVNVILNEFPGEHIDIYQCNRDHSGKADAIAYLLKFQKKPTTNQHQLLAVASNLCDFPSTQHYDFRIATTAATFHDKVYPSIKGTPVADFTTATPGALKNASWSAVTTQKVYQEAARWY